MVSSWANPNAPDIIVYEVGGVSREDFWVEGNRVLSSVDDDQPERHLDLTDVIGGAGMVEKIQIVGLEGPPDEAELAGFED